MYVLCVRITYAPNRNPLFCAGAPDGKSGTEQCQPCTAACGYARRATAGWLPERRLLPQRAWHAAAGACTSGCHATGLRSSGAHQQQLAPIVQLLSPCSLHACYTSAMSQTYMGLCRAEMCRPGHTSPCCCNVVGNRTPSVWEWELCIQEPTDRIWEVPELSRPPLSEPAICDTEMSDLDPAIMCRCPRADSQETFTHRSWRRCRTLQAASCSHR